MADRPAVSAARVSQALRQAGITGSPAEVARALGVCVEFRTMAPAVHGANPSDVRIVVNDLLEGEVRRFAIAHELGHVLARRDALTFSSRDEEQFADLFAAALLRAEAEAA